MSVIGQNTEFYIGMCYHPAITLILLIFVFLFAWATLVAQNSIGTKNSIGTFDDNLEKRNAPWFQFIFILWFWRLTKILVLNKSLFKNQSIWNLLNDSSILVIKPRSRKTSIFQLSLVRKRQCVRWVLICCCFALIIKWIKNMWTNFTQSTISMLPFLESQLFLSIQQLNTLYFPPSKKE